MRKAPKFFLSVLVVSGIFVLTVLGILDQPINYGRFLISKIATPVYQTSTQIAHYFGRWWRIGESEKRLSELEQQHLALVSQLVDQTELKKENESLRAALAFNREHKLRMIPAEIFARLTEGGLDLLSINAGLAEQVEKGDAVVDQNGVLLGTIWQVDSKTAKVLLIINQKSKIGAELVGNNNFGGIVEGQYGLGIVLTTIPKDLPIKPNDIVITSGIEDSVPRGLKIGEVDEVLIQDQEPFNKAILRNFVDNKTVYRVFVVKK